MKRSPLIWMFGAVTAHALGSVVQKPYAMNSTASAVIPPPYASGMRLPNSSPLSSRPCDSLTDSALWPTASVVLYPIVSLPAGSLVTPTASLVSASLSDVLETIMPTLSSSADPTPGLASVNSPRIVNRAAAIAASPASSTIDLELLSSILLSGLPDTHTKTEVETTAVIVSLTLPYPLPTPSSDDVSGSLVATTTSATGFPTSSPFSYNPSASQGSATPISRPTLDSSSGNVVGSTLSTSSTPSTTGNMEIPPAPSAAGASGSIGGTGKERVWWVAFLVPLLFAA